MTSSNALHLPTISLRCCALLGASLVLSAVGCAASSPPPDAPPDAPEATSSAAAEIPSSAPIASSSPSPPPSASVEPPVKDEGDKLVLNESGSTNSSGRTITVHADGKAHVDVAPGGRGVTPTKTDCTVTESLAKKVFSDLTAVGPLDSITFGKCAAQSASFGQTTSLEYHGHSADIGLDCGPPKEAKAKPLVTDIKAMLLEVNKGCR